MCDLCSFVRKKKKSSRRASVYNESLCAWSVVNANRIVYEPSFLTDGVRTAHSAAAVAPCQVVGTTPTPWKACPKTTRSPCHPGECRRGGDFFVLLMQPFSPLGDGTDLRPQDRPTACPMPEVASCVYRRGSSGSWRLTACTSHARHSSTEEISGQATSRSVAINRLLMGVSVERPFYTASPWQLDIRKKSTAVFFCVPSNIQGAECTTNSATARIWRVESK